MTHYVFVHGAWQGSWCWHKIAKQFDSKSTPYTLIDLPGRGNCPLPFKKITLSTHVSHLLATLSKIPDDIVLVSHSMGGIIASQAAEEAPNQIKRIIYVAGFLPTNGDSLTSLSEKYNYEVIPQGMHVDVNESVISVEEKFLESLFYHCCEAKDVALAKEMYCKEPYRPFYTPVTLSQNYESIPKLYIQCTKDKALTLKAQKAMCSRVPCEVALLDTDHSPFFSMPNQLVEIITS